MAAQVSSRFPSTLLFPSTWLSALLLLSLVCLNVVALEWFCRRSQLQLASSLLGHVFHHQFCRTIQFYVISRNLVVVVVSIEVVLSWKDAVHVTMSMFSSYFVHPNCQQHLSQDSDCIAVDLLKKT